MARSGDRWRRLYRIHPGADPAATRLAGDGAGHVRRRRHLPRAVLCRSEFRAGAWRCSRHARSWRRCWRKADVVLPLAALVGAPLCARDEVGAITLNRDAVRGSDEARLARTARDLSHHQQRLLAGRGECVLHRGDARCARFRCTARPRWTPRRRCWNFGAGITCGWRPCSACRHACGSICWSTISPGAP